MPRARAHVWIQGSVQGVGFRFAAQWEAQRLSLGGWVRNLPDGRVEAVLEGEKSAVHRMLEWCRRGPSGAWVTHVEERQEQPTGEFHAFSIERTPR
jgi:acylphosphatase